MNRSARPTPASRQNRVVEGIGQLRIWLEDLVRAGLAELERKPVAFWEAQAARLVDAQAPGLAERVRRCGSIARSGQCDWAARLLERLGSIALLCDAFEQIDRLPTPLQDDVRLAVGIPIRHEDVVARGQIVSDYWQVAAQSIDDEERLRVQKTWLIGERGGALGVDLQFAIGNAAFPETFAVGTRFAADLVYWPASVPTRVKILDRKTQPQPCQPCCKTALGSFNAMLEVVANTLARNPFFERWTFALTGLQIGRVGVQWYALDSNGLALPLAKNRHWELLALSAGRPFSMLTEWDGEELKPLCILADRQ